MLLDDVDHVERARWNVAISLPAALDQHLLQRRFDRRGRGALSVPDGVAFDSHRVRHMRRQACSGARIDAASAGPWEPAAYVGRRPGMARQASRIGSQMRHCASTSSLRVKRVASPRIASRISRSYASGDWERKVLPYRNCMLTGRILIPLPGTLAASDSETPSLGCTA